MFALPVTSLNSYGFLPVPVAAQVGVQRYVRPQSNQSQFLWNSPPSHVWGRRRYNFCFAGLRYLGLGILA